MPSAAASLLDNPKISLDELASQALMDVISTIVDGNDLLNQSPVAIYETSKKPSVDNGDDLTSGPLSSETETEKTECPAPSLPITKTMPAQGLAVSYLLRFYININFYARGNAKKCSEPPLSDMLQSLRSNIVNHLVLVLLGKFDLEKCPKSPLLPYILIGNAPSGVISELVVATYEDKEVFEEVSST